MPGARLRLDHLAGKGEFCLKLALCLRVFGIVHPLLVKLGDAGHASARLAM